MTFSRGPSLWHVHDKYVHDDHDYDDYGHEKRAHHEYVHNEYAHNELSPEPSKYLYFPRPRPSSPHTPTTSFTKGPSFSYANGEWLPEPAKYLLSPRSKKRLTTIQSTINMPHLIYAPSSEINTKPTYAIGYLDPVDETILQDLIEWGWKVEPTTNEDPKWQAAIQEEDEGRKPLLKEFWQDETARRAAEQSSKGKKPNKLVKQRPSEGASRSHSRGFSWRSETPKTPTSTKTPETGSQEAQQKQEMDEQTPARRTVGEIRKQVAQAQQQQEAAEASKTRSASELGELPPGGPPIFKYGTVTFVDTQAQLNQELQQEIADWNGIGILKTTQVSVVSEEGIAVDEKGERVYFPPKWDLGLFPWEEEVQRSGSTKSKESMPSNLEDLKRKFSKKIRG